MVCHHVSEVERIHDRESSDTPRHVAMYSLDAVHCQDQIVHRSEGSRDERNSCSVRQRNRLQLRGLHGSTATTITKGINKLLMLSLSSSFAWLRRQVVEQLRPDQYANINARNSDEIAQN